MIAGRARAGESDGISDHGLRLRDALVDGLGAAVDICERQPDASWRCGDWTAPHLADAARGRDAVLLQYNPFLYGRWGVAPWLPGQLRAIRRGGARAGVMVHETAMPLRGVRSSLMGMWQRAQLRAVVANADVVFVSIEQWARRIAAFRPRRPVLHLPVGSNLPDMREAREVARVRLEIDAGTVAVATLSTGHPSHLIAPVRDSVNALAAAGHRVTLLRLGAGAPDVEGLDERVRVHRPGAQSAALLAAGMAAADIALMPYVDGASTRRGGLMAALQHGVAVVGSDGPLTDPSLRSSGLTLVPHAQMSQAALHLAGDSEARIRAASLGRRIYLERYDWPVIAGTVLGALRGDRA